MRQEGTPSGKRRGLRRGRVLAVVTAAVLVGLAIAPLYDTPAVQASGSVLLRGMSSVDWRSSDSHASTAFVVTTTADTSDANPGDGVCDDGTGECSLRAAVQEANALAVPIDITLPAGGYTVMSSIDVTGDISIRGAGSSLAWLGAGGSVWTVFVVSGGASIAIHDAGFSSPDGAALIEVRGSGASVRLEDFAAHQVDWTTVWAVAGQSDGVTVEVVRSTFTDVVYGIFFADGSNQTLDVRDSSFLRSYSAIFLVSGPGGSFAVTDTRVEESERAGIQLYRSESLPMTGTASLEVLRSSFTGSPAGRGIWVSHPWGQQESRISTHIVESELSDNVIYGIEAGGELVIERSTLSRNGSGAIDHSVGPVAIRDSTISDNGSAGARFFGDHPTLLEIVNSTFSGNERIGLLVPRSNSVLRNVTITGTHYDEPAWSGGLAIYSQGALVENSVIAGNARDCYPGLTFTSGGHNLDSDGTCSFDQPTDQQGVDPLLGPLADNGGSTLTHLPLAGSPLIDAGSNELCPPTDQRGMARPADGNGDGQAVCDIGAVEAGAGPGPTEPVSGSLAGTVAVTFDTAGPCLIVHAASVDFGTNPFNDGTGGLAPGTVNSTGESEFFIENCSDGEIEILARGTDAQSRTSGAAWGLTANTDTCALGPDHYGLADSGPAGITPVTLLDQSVDILTGGALRLTELFIRMPCVGSAGAGETFNLTVFFTAVLP
jgi:CSLREA domain-containing protein